MQDRSQRHETRDPGDPEAGPDARRHDRGAAAAAHGPLIRGKSALAARAANCVLIERGTDGQWRRAACRACVARHAERGPACRYGRQGRL